MKILYIHARNLRVETGSTSGNPSHRKRNERRLMKRLGDTLPILENARTEVASKNALLVLVCVERGDEKLDVRLVQNDVLRARAMIGVADIVVGSFAHLSSNIAAPSIARLVIDRVVTAVEICHIKTEHGLLAGTGRLTCTYQITRVV